MSVEFHDFSVKVKKAIDEAAIAWLEEASGELKSQTISNLDKEKGRWHSEQKEKWENHVFDEKLEAVVGNPMQRSLWTEFGTGEYADGGKGRKGYWVYVKGNETNEKDSSKGGKEYTLEEAKRIMAMMRADGLDAHITKGQPAKRPFRKAFTKLKPKLIKRANEIFKENLK